MCRCVDRIPWLRMYHEPLLFISDCCKLLALITMKSVLSSSLLVIASAEYYCPAASDMNAEHGNVQFQDGGWAFTGDARVSSKTSFNLLGGYMEFDMDTSQTHPEVNTNFYTSSPAQPNCGEAC